MTSLEDLAAVILAGGEGRRLAGMSPSPGDKTLIEIGGKPILQHVIDRLRPQASRMILSANGDLERFSPFGLSAVSDGTSERSGPLDGFLAGMTYWERQLPRPSAILTIPADCPFLPLDLASQLLSASRGEQPAIAVSNGRHHPTIGIWPLTFLPHVREALSAGRRRLHDFAEQHHAIEVAFPFGDIGGMTIDPFFNVNTPDDVAFARSLFSDHQ